MKRLTLLGIALALVGCGGDEQRGTPASKKVVIATLGDSITAGTPAEADPKSHWQYWAGRRLPNVQFRNCGVNRERTEQIFVRLDACAKGAQAIVIQGGINDIAQGLPPAFAAGNLEAMVVRAKRMGLRVAIAELLPWNNGYPTAAEPINELNRMISAIAKRHGAAVVPFYATLEDPHRPGRMPAAWTVEGDHPSIAGYRRLGELAVAPAAAALTGS